MTNPERRIRITERESVDMSLSGRDVRHLESDERLDVRRHGDGRVTLTVDRYVGVIGLPSGTIVEIEPKISCNLLFYLAYTDRLSDSLVAGVVAGHGDDTSFVNLVARLLVDEADRILKQGLHQAYITQQSTETHLRGQLNQQQQLQRHGHAATTFECQYDELSRDILINKILLDALHRLQSLVSKDTLRQMLTRYIGQIQQDVSHERVDTQSVANVHLTRLTAHYRDAIQLSELILNNTFVSKLRGGGRQLDSLLINMEQLFENVVVRAVQGVVADDLYTVQSRGIGPLVVSHDGTAEARMYPDFSIVNRETGSIEHVGDAKWKTDTRPAQGDLYQLAAYQGKHTTSGTMFYPNLCDRIADEYSYDTSDGRAAGRGALQVTELPETQASYDQFRTAIYSRIQSGLPAKFVGRT